jgi:hypothetical protein
MGYPKADVYSAGRDSVWLYSHKLWFNQIILGGFTYVMEKAFFAAVHGGLYVAGGISRMVKDIAVRGKTT